MAKDYLLTSIAAVLLGMTMFEPGRCKVPGHARRRRRPSACSATASC
jgi:hypothetical protein